MTKMIKTPPHNLEAEQSILGCMLLKEQAIAIASTSLSVSDFYQPRNGMIFDAIMKLHNRGSAVDTVTVMQELGAGMEQAGGINYLATLTGIVPSLSSAKSYCQIIKSTSISRKLIEFGQDVSADALDGIDPEDVFDKASQALLSLSASTTIGSEPTTLADLAEGVIDHAQKSSGQDDISGITTGIDDLDQLLWGWQKTDLIVLAGRPGMGKTTMALNFVTAAAGNGHGVAFFSLEMGREQLAMKMISEMSQVPLKSLQRGIMTDSSWPKLINAAGRAKHIGTNIVIDDTPALSVPRLRGKLKMVMMRRKIDLVIVDYMQLMTAPGKENRTQEIGEISRSLKALAKELRVPVIALSQLNRSLESRNDKRPMLSDLRESGAIEQDADIIIFLYRDDYYNKNSPFAGVTEINVAKHRNGETDRVNATFIKETSSFRSMSTRDE